MPIGAFRLNSLSKATLTASVEVIRRKKTIQAIGNVQISDTQSKFGGSSAYFDADGDRLHIEGTNIIGTAFTHECWVYVTSLAFQRQILTQDDGSSNNQGSQFRIRTNGTVDFVYWTSSSRASAAVLNSTGTVSLNTWTHLAAVWTGSTLTIYKNGSSIASTSVSSMYQSTAGFAIGGFYGLGADPFAGYIDEVRISKTARYTSNFTAPTTPFTNDDNTLLLLHMDGSYLTNNFYDDNGIRLPKPMTNNNSNAKLSTTQAKFGGTSLVCDGNFDFVTTRWDQTYSELAFGTGDFTAECWAYLSGNSTGQILISLRNASAGQYSNMLAVGGGYLEWSDGTAWRLSTTTFPINQWVHVAVTRTSGTLRLFQNGTQVYSATNTVNLTGARPYYIGSADDGSYSTNGYIDEVRVSNISRYSSAFTPSTAPFVNDSNTLLLLHFNGSNNSTIFLDDTGDGRTQNGVVAIGNAQISTTQRKFGGTSAYFDGTGDYLNVTSSTLAFGTGDFTFECWFYSSIISNTQTILSFRDPNTADLGLGITLYASKVNIDTYAYNYITGTTTLSSNTWYHVAVSRSGNSMKLFINGVQEGSTATVNFNLTNYKWNIGYGPNGYFTGYIDELRVSNNARYTSNFTPASEQFANDVNTLLLLHMDGNNTSTIFIDDNGKKTYTI